MRAQPPAPNALRTDPLALTARHADRLGDGSNSTLGARGSPDGVNTHAGDTSVPVKRVALDVRWGTPYADAILVFGAGREVRAVDPFTGASELVPSGVDQPSLLALGAWHVDLPSGERRLVLGRIEPDAEWIDPRRLLVRFGDGSSVGLVWADRLSGDVIIPGEGTIYLDVQGPDPGLWARPLP